MIMLAILFLVYLSMGTLPTKKETVRKVAPIAGGLVFFKKKITRQATSPGSRASPPEGCCLGGSLWELPALGSIDGLAAPGECRGRKKRSFYGRRRVVWGDGSQLVLQKMTPVDSMLHGETSCSCKEDSSAFQVT